MNKKLLLATLLTSSVSIANADWQKVKEYDFTVYSAETVANLTEEANASPAGPLWYVASDDIIDADAKVYKRFKGLTGKKSPTAQLYANGELIKEIECIGFPSMDAKDFTLRHNYGETSNGFQLGSSNKDIKLLGLETGQMIEFSFTSSNTTPRGFTGAKGLELCDQTFPVNSSGEIAMVKAIVNNPETAALTWGAGIILKGMTVYEDIEVVETPKKIAYFYDSSYNAAQYIGTESDPVYPALADYYDVEKIDIKDLNVEDIAGYATGYDAIFITEAIGGKDVKGIALKELVGVVPMVNTKSFFYTSGRWSWATPANPSPKTPSVTLTEEGKSHILFTNTDADEDGVVMLYDGTSPANNYVQGWTASESDLIASDVVLAMAGSASAIHEHTTTDGANYVLIPLSSDGINTATSNALRLLVDACDYVINGKVSLKARKPSITAEDIENGKLITIVSETEGATIYYTLDGTKPTKKSNVYTEPFTLDKTTTVIAIAAKEDYVTSASQSESYDINATVAMPAVVAESFGKGLMLSIYTTTSEASIYYTIDGTEPTTESTVYSSPFFIENNTLVKAIAVKDGYSDSKLLQEEIIVPLSSDKLYLAYFYNSTYTIKKDGVNVPTFVATEDDAVLAALKNIYNVVLVDVNTLTAADAGKYENGFDMLYITESISGTHAFGLALKNLVGVIPMVNTKAFFYTSGRWSFAAPKNPTDKTGTMAVTETGMSHDIFKGINVVDGLCQVFEEVTDYNQLQAWDSPEQVIAQDIVLSTVEDYNCVHLHQAEGEKAYVLVPFSSDDHEKINANGVKLLLNACEFVTTGAVATSIVNVTDKDNKEISTVEIYNVSGIRISKLTDGVNIIKTTYKDGSVSSQKVIK